MLPEEKNVFVVEDDTSVSRAIERLLNAAGFHAVIFPSAEALLAHSGVTPACMVLDICLPGLSGFGLQQRFASSGVKPPVIFITAQDKAANRRRAGEAGAVAYLAKPFLGQDLVAAVAMALGS